MKKNILFVLFPILFVAALNAQSLDSLNWISGYWTSNENGTAAEELWTPASGGILIGLHRDVSENENSSFEFLRITKTEEGIVYIASPNGKTPTSFKLTRLAQNTAVFENPEHDFPQRLIYSRKGNVLTARIEDHTATRHKEWTWAQTALKSSTINPANMKQRVIGIGGIFLKADNPEATKSWYKKHLGIQSGQYGGTFEWKKTDNPAQNGYTAWSIFKSDTDYTKPSKKDAMINYRVENLEELLRLLKEEGVEIIGEMETYEYGKFGWIMDPNGYKIELWEPNDEEYGKLLNSSEPNKMN